MKSEHMIIIALLLVLIFLQARSKYGVQDPASAGGVGGGFYKPKTGN